MGQAEPSQAPAPSKPDETEQRRIKADLIAEAFASAGLDAMALSAGDWSLGTDFVRELVARHRLPVLAANLVCEGSHPYPGGTVLEQGGRKIGVVGITVGPVEGCEVTDPAEAIQRAVGELGKVDVVLGLFPYDSDRTVAELWNQPLPVDLALDARGRTSSAAETHGSSWWLSGGSRGKMLGLLELSFQGGDRWVATGGEEQLQRQLETAETRLKGVEAKLEGAQEDQKERLLKQKQAYEAQVKKAREQLAQLESARGANRFKIEQIELDDSVPDHEATQKLVAQAKDKITKLAPFDPGKFIPRIVSDAASPFAGGEVCVGCHREQHAQWSTTAHARAWQGLVAVNRAMEGDCWSCHVTGAGLQGGPTHPMDSGGFRDVQCEACHGPARAHILAPTDKSLVTRTPTAETCVRCHDGKQDGGRFDFEKYLPQVVHQAAAGQSAGKASP